MHAILVFLAYPYEPIYYTKYVCVCVCVCSFIILGSGKEIQCVRKVAVHLGYGA
jgi:hypothetical protein